MDQISKDLDKSIAKHKKELAELKKKNRADRIVITKVKARKKSLKTVKVKKFTVGRGTSKIIVSNIKRRKWIEGYRYTMDLTNASNRKNKIRNFERFEKNVPELRKSVRKYWFPD